VSVRWTSPIAVPLNVASARCFFKATRGLASRGGKGPSSVSIFVLVDWRGIIQTTTQEAVIMELKD